MSQDGREAEELAAIELAEGNHKANAEREKREAEAAAVEAARLAFEAERQRLEEEERAKQEAEAAFTHTTPSTCSVDSSAAAGTTSPANGGAPTSR